MSAEGVQFWESLLQDSSKRLKQIEGTLLLVGDSEVGKSALLKTFCEKTGSRPEKEIVSYDYFNVYDEDLESSSSVNVWTLDSNTFSFFADYVLDHCSLNKLVIVIALDLSKDNCKASLCNWLERTQEKLKEFILNNDKKCVTAESIPILVVGCKSDLLQVDEVDGLKRAKLLQGELRSICLSVRAGLVFTSTIHDDAHVNIEALRSHCSCLLASDFDGAVARSGNEIQEGTTDVFIPVGSEDTPELIYAATGVNVTTVSSASMKSSASHQSKNEKAAQNTQNSVENSLSGAALEQQEEEWLQQLMDSLGSPPQLPASADSESLSALSTPSLSDSKSRGPRRSSVAAPTSAGENATKKVGKLASRIVQVAAILIRCKLVTAIKQCVGSLKISSLRTPQKSLNSHV